ncbi:Rid family hydrolase [Streptomyces sp. NBC_01635]|uniref:RidA family protein n=1 Tax=Streptomyces sp. NBC_01635 TaxID=2975904 RepID=UPI00386EA142|nr:Rid family hydrolase [Streptomyces sp. NBC_01635]
MTLVDPEGLPEIDACRQVAIASGSRMVFIAGQVAWDAAGVTVGAGDLAAQVEQCCLDVATGPAAAGATFADAAKPTACVVDRTPDKMAQFMEGATRAARKPGTVPAAPATLVGVQALGIPDHLVEIEAVAVLD